MSRESVCPQLLTDGWLGGHPSVAAMARCAAVARHERRKTAATKAGSIRTNRRIKRIVTATGSGYQRQRECSREAPHFAGAKPSMRSIGAVRRS